MSGHPKVSFTDTATAFRHKTTRELKRALLLFKSFDFPLLLKVGPTLSRIAVFAGFKGLIRNTIFSQFCGGETIHDSEKAITYLADSHVGTILDYSVEGEETEEVFSHTCDEIIKTIKKAAADNRISFSVFKTTGIIRFDILEKVSAGVELTNFESRDWVNGKDRFEKICTLAFESGVKLFIDAEESWIQPAIDDLAEQMMDRFNKEKAIIFNTIQLYRHDRLAYLKNQINSKKGYLGYKLVRGAYMEKEAERAREMGYESPIQPDKIHCDNDYNEALKFCVEHIDHVAICAGTHNEDSSMYLTELMDKAGLQPSDERIYFSQLLGMSDHISFNLASQGYNVAKYVPYGPVSAVIPYLTRRARENSSVAGQMGRERMLIEKEIKRRKMG